MRPEMCISNQFPGDTAGLGPTLGTTLWGILGRKSKRNHQFQKHNLTIVSYILVEFQVMVVLLQIALFPETYLEKVTQVVLWDMVRV